ncbi:hypothetical protein THAOC_07502 [Thalassiosira oceanica]|uniref:Uncharacterized protein n=1 Tax=Thalassiosira oceanica TaxID=159749 RepID=K0T1P4_THAOC|nr:hypothetical protein THAOC_07502 [Thalassiosira oceanica]|eukprot:EJK71089.1 hypothetical protein THAOC_07502 [Thalassiosira oceanica]
MKNFPSCRAATPDESAGPISANTSSRRQGVVPRPRLDDGQVPLGHQALAPQEGRRQYRPDCSAKNDEDGPAAPLFHLTSSARLQSHLPTPDEADPDLDNKTTPYAKECTARFRSSALDPAGEGRCRTSFAGPHTPDGRVGRAPAGRGWQRRGLRGA